MTGALPARHRGVGIAGTTIAHATLIVLAIVAARRAIPRGPQVYEVNLVAAPLPSAGSRTADATKTPAPKAVAPVKSKPVPPTVKPTSKPTPAPTAKAPAPANGSAPAALIKTPVVPAPGEKPSTGSDVATVHQDGLVFPYPEYLKKIENAIYNNWNHQSFRPGLEARIAFVITKSGIVPDSSYNVMKASSNSSFDNASRGAIEAASNKHEFGPLPDGFNGASLPILFVFKQVPRSSP